MPPPKKSVAAEPPKWVALPHDLYATTCAELVTFSHKTANSNAPPGGIRLAPEQALKLPYVSARTLLGVGEVPALDYVANAGKTATVVKQLNQLREGVATAPANEATRILATLAAATAQGAQIGTDKVSLRARQLLLPRQGGYVSVTPLTSGGVNRKLRTKVRQHNEHLREVPDENLRRIPVAIFGLGGSNPQNVGSLVRDMQRPLVFFAPTENRQLKAVLALHFQGVRMRLPRPLLRGFRDWYADCRRRHGGRIPTNMDSRDEEIVHVRAIARAILAQGDAARQRLLAQRDVLPAGGSPLVSAEADPVARGLVDPELRDKEWPRAFALRLARLIADYRFGDGKDEFQFEQADIFELQAMIEEVVR
ncbi:hypothetical protein [Rhodocyclus gracilis]|uniref:hypothetical protein n=1 Tax=Rhodocyclus gracilis TaxID=2929842 RepID=UPI00188E92BF|nr:hypothetical protein [Rhodocyclus gracilis]